MKILGIDPALNKSGWGVIEVRTDNTAYYIDSGIIKIDGSLSMPEKLKIISAELASIIIKTNPDEIAIEEIFLNKNPMTSLKLGHARGGIITTCLQFNLPIFEYAANLIKKSICGAGRAEKSQVAQMVKILLPKAQFKYDDESDALAICLCHLHHREMRRLTA